MTYRYILIFYVLNMCFKQIITLTILIMDFLWCIWKEDMQKNGKMKDCVVLILIFMKGGGVFVPLKNYSLIWRRYHYWWRATNLDIYSALMAIEQWEFFYNVPHVLWHGPTFYNGHLRENPWHSHLLPKV